jgi:hypothetical protein
VSYVADGAALFGKEGHARYPDDEDNQVSRAHRIHREYLTNKRVVLTNIAPRS